MAFWGCAVPVESLCRMWATLCSALGVRSLEPVGLRHCLLWCSRQSEGQWEFGHQKSAKSNYAIEGQN